MVKNQPSDHKCSLELENRVKTRIFGLKISIKKVEKAKTAAAEERCRHYQSEAENSNEKYKILLNELESSKRRMPDPHLQAEIKTLLIEKSEFEKRIETLQKAKTHYKA